MTVWFGNWIVKARHDVSVKFLVDCCVECEITCVDANWWMMSLNNNLYTFV